MTIKKPSQAFPYKFSKNHWLSFSLFSLGMFTWLIASNANLYQTGDTKAWVSGAQWLKDCFLQIHSEACSRISPWPIWNNLLALVFSKFTDDQMRLWYYSNIISFIIYLSAISFTIRKFAFKWRFLMIYSIFLSPLLFQVNSTCTEIQQGLFLTLALLSFIRRYVILTALLIPLSIITKETLILTWVIILIFNLIQELASILKSVHQQIQPQNSIDKSRQFFGILLKDISILRLGNTQIRTLIIGILVGSLASFGFNYIRYHHFKNIVYFASNAHLSMGLNYMILNFKWSLISPNGGIVFAYGLFLSIIFSYLISRQNFQIFLLSRLYIKRENNINNTELHQAKSSLRELIIFIIILLTSGLFTTSMWWAAFGWDTWGNRLIIPYAMPMIVLFIRAIQQYIQYYEQLIPKKRETLSNVDNKSSKININIMKKFIVVLIAMLAICGLIYNLVTIQAVYRKDKNVFIESLHSQHWCQKMISDSRGIASYYWQCAMERFQYIPIIHHPPRIIGFEGEKLISIALISLFINITFLKLTDF
jgi:hypothetical protein